MKKGVFELHDKTIECASTFRHCHTTVFDVQNNYVWHLKLWRKFRLRKIIVCFD